MSRMVTFVLENVTNCDVTFGEFYDKINRKSPYIEANTSVSDIGSLSERDATV